jgi:hypothetical protein
MTGGSQARERQRCFAQGLAAALESRAQHGESAARPASLWEDVLCSCPVSNVSVVECEVMLFCLHVCVCGQGCGGFAQGLVPGGSSKVQAGLISGLISAIIALKHMSIVFFCIIPAPEMHGHALDSIRTCWACTGGRTAQQTSIYDVLNLCLHVSCLRSLLRPSGDGSRNRYCLAVALTVLRVCLHCACVCAHAGCC